jgi:hypothetical protein
MTRECTEKEPKLNKLKKGRGYKDNKVIWKKYSADIWERKKVRR